MTNHAYVIPIGEHSAVFGEQIDAAIREWDDRDWQGFLERYMNAQFHRTGPMPRACIPAQFTDDDLVLGRIIDHARAHLNEV